MFAPVQKEVLLDNVILRPLTAYFNRYLFGAGREPCMYTDEGNKSSEGDLRKKRI
jgi:hypothetical protein